MNQTWILIGDGSHARLFQTTDAAGPWQMVRKLDREHSREKTDRNESHEDRGEHDFARLVVSELEKARQQGTFSRLVLVAPPKFLGQLGESFRPPSKPASSRVSTRTTRTWPRQSCFSTWPLPEAWSPMAANLE